MVLPESCDSRRDLSARCVAGGHRRAGRLCCKHGQRVIVRAVCLTVDELMKRGNAGVSKRIISLRAQVRLSLAALTLSSAMASAESLQIREGYVRELPPGQSTSAAYMDVVNGSNRPVAIVAAVSDAAQVAEVHQHRHVNGAMSMEQVRRLVIPARDHVLFTPGGYHLMLINLKRTLRAGDTVTVTLLDEEGKSYTARIPVVKMVGAGK